MSQNRHSHCLSNIHL